MEVSGGPEGQETASHGEGRMVSAGCEAIVEIAVLESAHIHEDAEALKGLPPLANQIVDSAIDNMTRKLIAGYRNKDNARPNARNTEIGAEAKKAAEAVSAQSVMEVANRGQCWKELIQKSLTRGISSLSTMEFDGEIKIVGGERPSNFNDAVPRGPGVYVVFDDATGKPVYVGDSENMWSRWNAGHFNEYRQGQRANGERYKLADEFETGCTVKFISMESKETAAALEAHLIRENFDQLKNKRGELETQQGKRSNQEAKKMKDASGGTGSLVFGAAGEAAKNAGYDLFEQLTTTIIKAVKDELVDILRGGKARIAARIKRLLDKIVAVLMGVFDNALALLRGLVEFIVNAISKAIAQIYNLVRNVFDLAKGAWELYRGSKSMSREELVRKISETIIVSGSLVIWNAVDPIIEAKLAALGPFAPYVSASVVAVGFCLSSYALQSIVTRVIDSVVAFKQGVLESLEAAREACEALIRLAESELALMADLADYVKESLALMHGMQTHTVALTSHEPIEPLDLKRLLERTP